VSITRAPAPSSTRGIGTWIRHRAGALAPYFVLLVLILVFSIAAPTTFLTMLNLRNVLSQVAVLAVVSTGVTMVLLLGEIDLSIAAIATLAGVVATMLYEGFKIPMGDTVYVVQVPVVGAVLIAWALVLFLGFLNGVVTTRIGLPTFIVTLAISIIADGMGLFFTKGSIKYTIPALLNSLGSGYVLKGDLLGDGIPTIIIVAAVVLTIGHLLLTRTRFGRYVYMSGGNREAAELSGINTKLIVTIVFSICGFLSGMAGMLNVGRLGSAQAYGLSDMLLDSIAAVVLGGTSLFGGVGGIINTVVGLFIFGVIGNGLNLVQVDIYLKPFVRGTVLLIALIINVYAMRLRTLSVESDEK
jgi:ribose transport system permease protein